MLLSQIHLRDPYILPFEGKYYLFGTPGAYAWAENDGFFCYISEDLKNWSEPIHCFKTPKDFWADTQFWAPEVHLYHGKFYMFASFYTKSKAKMRATQVLVADRPQGPYTVLSDPLTPSDWMCLDGTLYVENDVPYMVFCHEWLQVTDGEMCAMRLSNDLTHAMDQPRVLFYASEPHWAPSDAKGYVTDGPFLYKTAAGKLLMIWSSFDSKQYVLAVAQSDNGRIDGKWTHCQNLLFSANGGHGMIFRTFDGRLMLTLHSPNDPYGAERPQLIPIRELLTDPYLSVE